MPARTLAQRLDDRYAAADRGLEVQLRAASLGKDREPETVRREHRLIGRNDRYTARERGLDRVQRRSFRSADQFDENVDIGGSGKLRCAGEVDSVAKVDPPTALAARAIGDDCVFSPRARGEPGPLPLQKTNEAGPDHADTGDAQTKRLRHSVLAPPSTNPDGERLFARIANRINEARTA